MVVWSRIALSVGFAALLVFFGLAAVSTGSHLPDLTAFASALGAALVGVVINPTGCALMEVVWWLLVARALGVGVLAGVMVFMEGHPNAVASLTAAAAAFGALFVNTQNVVHSGN